MARLPQIFTLFLLTLSMVYGFDIRPRNYHGKVKFIQQIELNYNFGGYSFHELSALACKNHKLLMVSDKGILFRFKATFDNKGIKLTPLSAHFLKRKNGKRLKKFKRDSEGIALDAKGNIYIAFEGKPKIAQFNSNGDKLKNIHLPKHLKRAKLRSRNKSLESLTYHPKYGLLTALELPPKGVKKSLQSIYSTSGKVWHFKIDPIEHNAITDIEVMDDGNLLVLQRAFLGIFSGYVITLTKLFINNCKSGTICKSEKLLQMRSSDGWKLQNFEGLAHVEDNKYLLISDDNENFLQKTVLLYVKIE